MTFRVPPSKTANMGAETKSALRTVLPALLSSISCAALLAAVVVISESQSSTPQLELLQSKAAKQELVGVTGKARRWETEAESAADRAYRLEKERREAKLQAANLQSQEQHWLQKAQAAREKAEALRIGGGQSANRLQEEKEALKRRLARNEEEMQMVEHMEKQPAPWRGQRAEAHAAHDPKIAHLEEELHHQISAYRQAREVAAQHDRSRGEVAEERELEAQIAHFRKARETIDAKLQHKGFAPLHPARSAPVRYRAEPRVAHPRRPDGTILGTAEKALGDSVMKTSEISTGKKASGGAKLPGVNAYSWWSNKPAKIDAAEEIKKLRQPKEKKENCHNLYSCVGSLFGGGSKSKLSEANKQWQEEKARERREEAARHESGRDLVETAARSTSPSSDRSVSVKDVERDPQQPLLGALDAAVTTHDRKLPGVAENRWGGTKFWQRLLGGPHAPTKQLK